MWRSLIAFFVAFAALAQAPATAQSAQLSGIELTQPPIDYEMIHRIWVMLKKETGAPDALPYPPIVLDWDVPKTAMMGLQYPTKEFPDNRLQMSLAPRTLDLMKDQEIFFGIGHELTHYLLLMKENKWDTGKRTFTQEMRHHCNPEFQRIMRVIIQKIWDTYHDDVMRNRLANEPRRSCTAHPEQ